MPPRRSFAACPAPGWGAPAAGWRRRSLPAVLVGALTALGCGEETTTHSIGPIVLGLSADSEPTYDDGELTLFEVKLPVRLPIAAPRDADLDALRQVRTEPYGRHPWVTAEQVAVQVSWTLTNLDPEPVDVRLLLDPWNEFGRYWPGLALIDADDAEFLPNLSGYDLQIRLPGTTSDPGGDAAPKSRVSGTITYDDMQELAVDFATVINVIENPPPPIDGGLDIDPSLTYVNHAFHLENRSHDPRSLIAPYVPQVIAGLTGFDLGLRTFVPANVAIEIVIEVTDQDGGLVLEPGSSEDLMIREPTRYFTVGM
ncbi:MAG TPA: hypothetical protein VKZ49_06400 [Polyangiaceae bacterium]|nr:hypothetical protein [Polyangiaceae bacterium]